MIINLRGNNASGKSTTVRKILARFEVPRPIYGILGTKAPEAYCCQDGKLFVIGPYNTPGWGGCDVITKKGFGVLLSILEKYLNKGKNILFEGILVSLRYGQIGEWLEDYKDQTLVLALDVSLEECLRSLHRRQDVSGVVVGEKNLATHQKQLVSAYRRLQENGFNLEYITREEVVDRIWSVL